MTDVTTPAEIYKVELDVFVGNERIGEAVVYVRSIGEEDAVTFARQAVEGSHLWDERIHGKRMQFVDISELADGEFAVPEGETIHGLPAPDDDAGPGLK